MVTVNEKMTAIADEIRTLSGTTGTMGLDAMASHVGEANDEVDNQVELLAQAVAALEGKASGSGEDLDAELTTQESLISELSSILDSKVNGGSGGASIETCTLTLNIATSSAYNVQFTYADENGQCVYYAHDTPTFQGSITMNKGLFIIMYDLEVSGFNYMTTTGGVEFVQEILAGRSGAVFNVTGDGSITF